MENKEIMEKLLDSNHSTMKVEDKVSTNPKKWDENSISRIRVVTAKYKVYLVLLLIFIAILVLEYIPDMKSKYDSREASYDQVKSQLLSVKGKIVEAQKEEQYLNEIIENEDILKSCLNEETDESCSLLPDSWKKTTNEWEEYDYVVPLSYLQINSLYDAKMLVDEKKVLKNLNEYLIKEDILWNSRTRVWDLLKISIGDPTPVVGGDQHFFVVPVDVTIEFVTIDDLIWFLYNVEKKLINRWEDRILYKIQTVSYDIISNDEPQVTDITMLAYYYYDEKFENLEENENVTVDGNEQSSENVADAQ